MSEMDLFAWDGLDAPSQRLKLKFEVAREGMNRSEAPTSETVRLLWRLGVIILSEPLEEWECIREKYRGE